MDTIQQEHEFCAFCLCARLPNVQFCEQISESSDELQTSLQTLLGHNFWLENFTICKPCWKIAQLFQDFRLRCLQANKLVEHIGLGLRSEDDWFSERNLATIESIRIVIQGQLQEIEKLAEISRQDDFVVKTEFTEIKPEPIDEDFETESNDETGCFPDENSIQFKQEYMKDSVEDGYETTLDINDIRIEAGGAYVTHELHPDYAEEDELEEPIRNVTQSSHSYPCPECPMIFTNHRRQAAHVIKHAGDRPFKCRNNCEKTFATTMNRRRHERRCGKEVFQCNLCEVQLDRRRALYEHYNLAHPEEPRHPCPHCEKRFKKKEQLQRHERRIHSGERPKDWTCQQCGRSFAENCSLRKHMRIHN